MLSERFPGFFLVVFDHFFLILRGFFFFFPGGIKKKKESKDSVAYINEGAFRSSRWLTNRWRLIFVQWGWCGLFTRKVLDSDSEKKQEPVWRYRRRGSVLLINYGNATIPRLPRCA